MTHSIAKTSIIYPNVFFEGDVVVGDNSVVGVTTTAIARPTHIGDFVSIGCFCIIEDNVTLGRYTFVDHYSAIYSGARIGEQVKILYGAKVFSDTNIGNECIIGGHVPERMIVADRVTFMGQVAHSYRNATLDWDATIEPSPTIGIGSVVGVNALLIGDIQIGNNCYISAGEILKHDLPDDSVYLGGRVYPISHFKGFIKTKFKL